MTAKTETAVKSTIHSASQSVQSGVAQAESFALGAVERVEDGFAGAKAGFETAKAFGSEMLTVVDSAGRTTLDGVVGINSSLVSYGKDVLADSIEVGRKTIGAASVKDVVELQTAFAERRIAAAFETAAALNSLAQHNVLAMWQPFAKLVRDTTGTAEEFAKPVAAKAAKARAKSAA